MFEGRFGRLFRKLDPLEPSEEHLVSILNGMHEDAAVSGGWNTFSPPADEDNPAIPAGYTYLGQFIDHDITFDPASSGLTIQMRWSASAAQGSICTPCMAQAPRTNLSSTNKLCDRAPRPKPPPCLGELAWQ